MIHDLKTWPEPFQALLDGRKTCEVRKNDRAFRVGDVLVLREWNNHGSGGYTGRSIEVKVTHVTTGFGLADEVVAMSVRVVPPPSPAA